MADVTKWKSVAVPTPIYEEIKAVSQAEGRTLSNQLLLVWRVYRESTFHRDNDVQAQKISDLRSAGL
jgi:hypothetical protein|tara:strand:- start:340 stop:540 length:201 start_codon:yes stop_codon:yes gene_type:complete